LIETKKKEYVDGVVTISAMQINVAQFLKEATGSTRCIHVDEVISFDREATSHHITGEVNLIRVGSGILAQGRFDTQSQLSCSRCLSVFAYPFSFDVDDEFYPAVDIDTGETISQPEDSGAFEIDEHHILDMGELFRQSTLLAIPMKPLCCPECRGLCPQCGADLNNESCHCSSGNTTLLAAAFKNLKSTGKMG
jgi:uncharacterized protein